MGSTLPPPAHVPIQPGVGEKQHRQEGTPPFLPGWGELGTREGGGAPGQRKERTCAIAWGQTQMPREMLPLGRGWGGRTGQRGGGNPERHVDRGPGRGHTRSPGETLAPGGGGRGGPGGHMQAPGETPGQGGPGRTRGVARVAQRDAGPRWGGGTGQDGTQGTRRGGGGGGTHAVACRDSGPGEGTWGTHAGAWRNVSPGEGTWGRHGGPRGNMGHPERGGGAGETLAPGREHGISSTHA